MPYFLILLGTIFIFISLKMNNTAGVAEGNSDIFQDLLEEKLVEKKSESITEDFSALLSRLENLETSVLMFGDTHEAFEEDNELGPPAKEISDFSQEEVLVENINNKIFNLYDNGTDIEDICAALNIGKGEVLLRLGLRRQ